MTTPPGWYPDATGTQRWWDGYRWTEAVATPPPPKRGPALWIPTALLAAGLALIAWAATMGLPHPLSVFRGPHLRAPGSATLDLGAGPWVVYEENGTVASNGPVTSRSFRQTTILPGDISVAGAGPVTDETTSETVTINGRSYQGVARFRVPSEGSYLVTVASHDQPQRDVLVSRPLSYALRGWRGLVVGVLGGLVAAAGVGLLILSLSRRRAAAQR